MLPHSDYHPKNAGLKPGWLIAQTRTVSNFYSTESTCGYLGWKPKTICDLVFIRVRWLSRKVTLNWRVLVPKSL